MKKVTVKTVDDLLKEAQYRKSFKVLPKGNTFKDLSTVIVFPVPGDSKETAHLNCPKCKHKIEYEKTSVKGLHPMVVESWKRLIKPMNAPIVDMMVVGHEVGIAYNNAVDAILNNPGLKNFKYMLTIEHDNLVPYIPNTQGPLMMLYEDIEAGFDVVGGLYWTKGTPSMPLVYGEPKDFGKKKGGGSFKVIHNFKDGEVIECNGLGMGFTLFKLDIFRDKRLKKPYFKTCNEHGKYGPKMYTQDLYFFEQIRKLGYKVGVDTRVKVGHLDFNTGIIY